jgi:hypothetical protein
LRHCAIALLCYCTIALLRYCTIVLLRHCAIALLCYCTIALLRYCTIALLRYCAIALLRYCVPAIKTTLATVSSSEANIKWYSFTNILNIPDDKYNVRTRNCWNKHIYSKLEDGRM